MKAVVYRASEGALRETPLELGPLLGDELLVEHLAMSVESVPGIVARVTEVGDELRDDRARWVDRMVVIPALRACGACLPCRRGHPASCNKRATFVAWASHSRVAARLALAIDGEAALAAGLKAPDDPLRLAALAGVGLAGYAAVVRAAVEPNRAAIVVGRGPLAAWICAWVRHRGAEPIRADGPSDATRIAETLAARGVEAFGLPVIDTGSGLAIACALAPTGGTLVLCGSQGETTGTLIVERGLTVHGFAGAHPDLLPEACALVSPSRLDLTPLCRLVDRSEAARLAQGAAPSDEQTAIWVP